MTWDGHRVRRHLICAAAVLLMTACGASSGTGHRGVQPTAKSVTFNNSAPWPTRTAAPAAASRPSPEAQAQAGPGPPPIVQDPIPFGAPRKAEMAAYAQRHYGIDGYQLSDPHVIVEHYTETASFQATFNTFAPDQPDSELHELPGTCAHFVVDTDGTISQLVPLTIMCRHTVGLNYTAIGIEHQGMSDQDVLGNPAELHASLALTNWLRCRFHISTDNVIGHNESLTSPYHHELVPALQSQTHADMQKPDMDRYRQMLSAMSC